MVFLLGSLLGPMSHAQYAVPSDSLETGRPPVTAKLVFSEIGAGLLLGAVLGGSGYFLGVRATDGEDSFGASLIPVFWGGAGYLLGVPLGVYWVAAAGTQIDASFGMALLGSGLGGVLGVGILHAEPPGMVLAHLGLTILGANLSRRFRTASGHLAAFHVGRRMVQVSWPQLHVGAVGVQARLRLSF